LAYYIDNKKSEYSFWLYLFGVIMFWSGLTFTHSSSEFAKFIYFLINIVLLLIGVVIKRKVFLTFGSLGVIVYFFHLSELFRNSFIFVYMVTFMGIAFVWIGSRFDEYEDKIRSKLNFNININKKVLYIVLMILPLIYLVYFIQTSSKITHKKQIYKEKIVSVKCKNKIFKLHKIDATFIQNGKKELKIILTYKNKRFNSVNEFKKSYCQ
jgi:hypothetical protein